MIPVIFVVLLFFFGKLDATPDFSNKLFANANCSSYDVNDLGGLAWENQRHVDNSLRSQFNRFVTGMFVTVVKEDEGDDSGGATNPDGSYAEFLFFNASYYFKGMCDVPTSYGAERCSGDANDASGSFALGPNDAIAFFGCTPPPMRYFSYDTIIDARLTEEYPYFPGQNFGDTISNININTTAKDDDGTGNPFDAPAVVIQSASKKAAAAVADAYTLHMEMKPSSVSIRGIDSNIVRMWDRSKGSDIHASEADILTTIVRMTGPDPDITEGYTAYQSSWWPVRLYLADDDMEVDPEDLYNPPLIERYSDNVINEVTTLSDDYEMLFKSVEQNQNSQNNELETVQRLTFTTPGFYDDWDVILANPSNDSFVAGTRDAIYGVDGAYTDYESCLLTPQTVAVMIGVLHANVLDAAYSSAGVSMMAVSNWQSAQTNWFLDNELLGSAARYFPENFNNSNAFFAIDYVQPGGCAGGKKWCVEFNETLIDDKRESYILYMGERVYQVKETFVGPDADTTVPSRLLVFSHE